MAIFSNLWFYLIIFFILALFASKQMNKLAKGFVTERPPQRTFSIFSLQFPGSEKNLLHLIVSMSSVTRQAVKKHLLIDVIFMVGIYPALALLCIITARYLQPLTWGGSLLLQLIAASQIVALICDISENRMLYKKVSHPTATFNFLVFKWLVGLKFFFAFSAFTTSTFSLSFLWLSGSFSPRLTVIICIITCLMLIIYLIILLIKRAKRIEREKIELLLAQQNNAD